MGIHIRRVSQLSIMFMLVVLACVLACACAALIPAAYSGLGYSGLGYSGLGYSGLGYSGLDYTGLGYSHPGLVNPAPLAYNAVPATYSAAAFPSYETVSHTVDVTHPRGAARLHRQVLS